MLFPDDLDFADNDTVLFSDASTRYGYFDFLVSFMEHAEDGRWIYFILDKNYFYLFYLFFIILICNS